jgi:hypothetical protein
MATWQQFAESAPGFAGAIRAAFEASKSHVLATLRKDGSPRVSGSEVEFTEDGRMRIGSMADAVKGRDLKRDGRFALHAAPGNVDKGGADAKISGVVIHLAHEGSDSFELDIREAVLTSVENDELVVRFWTEEGGTREVRRK